MPFIWSTFHYTASASHWSTFHILKVMAASPITIGNLAYYFL
uniref:Uncharacterized protein n=1 Tax=Rhizophora mucronata TaxID=61149 RepID=A0A2P2N591_RHIMU